MIPRPGAAVTEIVFDALELEGEARRDYLDRACGRDPELRGEIESLLAADGSEGHSRFLARPALEGTGLLSSPAEAEEAGRPLLEVPERVGPFRIVSRLGFGGMGAVYLAQQDEPIERRVAVKVIHALHHAKWRRRFSAECQALARLNHPHIAALYEVGTTRALSGDGLPYVAMELVDGEPINTWCDRERSSLEQRLEIFLDVCAGISHAHQNGILHCDLKPGNVLVTRAEGRAKVIDFGIARAVDDLPGADSITRDLIFGSPPYVSPEMIDDGGRSPDTRTDVYALGLILYELLVGTLPFRVCSTWLLMLQISEKEPESPSARFSGLASGEQAEIAAARRTDAPSLIRRCRGDLDAIVVKAIDRDPDRRYGTAAELAADLRRHLAGEPIQARAPASAELLGRFLRRHKRWAISVILLFAVLSAGIVARTIEARRANAEAERANAEAERANAETERAQAALAESEQIRRFLIDLFQAANPEKTAGATVTVDELLEEGSKRLRTNLAGQPLVRASLLQTVGSIHTELGDFEQAGALVAEAAKIRSEHLPAADPLVVESQSELGIILRRLGRYEEAEPVLSKVLEARRADPDVDPELLAQAHNHLGVVYWRQDRFDEAETELRAGWTLRQDIGNAADIAESANNLGVLLQSSYRHQEAQVLLAQALEIFREELGPEHPRVGGALNNLGLVTKSLPSWADAQGLFRQASEIFREAYGPNHFRVLLSRRNLVDELILVHRWDEAFQEARDILRISEGLGDPIALAGARRRLGRVEIRAGLASQATQTLRRCVVEAEAARGPEHSATLACRGALAEAMTRVGEIEPAVVMLRELRRIHERLGHHRNSLHVELILGEAVLAGQRFAEAEGHFLAYLEALERASEPSAHSPARGYMGLGRALQGQRRLDEAAEAFRQAMAFRSEAYAPDHPLVGESAHLLGLVEIQRGRPSRARELLRTAASIRSGVYPPGDPDIEASLAALRSIE